MSSSATSAMMNSSYLNNSQSTFIKPNDSVSRPRYSDSPFQPYDPYAPSQPYYMNSPVVTQTLINEMAPHSGQPQVIGPYRFYQQS